MEVVPDAEGPYKWLVVFGAFMIQFLASGVTYCVGVFYVIFRQNLGGSSSLISFVSALNTGVFFGIGPVTGAIVNRYGCRGVAITGGLIGTLGLVLTAFVSQPWHLIITFGIITGFGLGLCYIPSITVISLYFGRNRSLAMGIAVTGLGAGPITFPPLLTYLDHVFGWRGAILLSAGLYLHSVVFAALLRHRTVWKGRRKLPGSPKGKEKVVPNGNHVVSRKSSLRNIPLLIFCIQNLIFSFGLSVINVHIGAFAISIGYSADQASMLFFAMGVASAISRVIYGLTVKVPLLRPIRVFTFTVLLCGAFTIAYPFCKSYIALVIIVSSIGVFYASYGSLPPLITIDLVGVENLATSYGYVCVADGIGFFLGGPIAGILYDSSKFYPASLWLGGGSMVISSIFMVTVWILDARLRHKMITENTLEVVS